MLRRAWLPKVLRATLLAVLVLAVAACGVGQQGPSQGGGGGGGPNKICMMPKLVGIPYFNASEQGANEAAKELDVVPLAPGSDKDVLEAALSGDRLPLKAVLKVKFDPNSREQRYDFMFSEYSKDSSAKP